MHDRDARSSRRSWGRLVLGLIGLAAWIVLVHRTSPGLPGCPGETFRANRDHAIEATALIYTESGDVADYLDEEHGRYCGGRSRHEPSPSR